MIRLTLINPNTNVDTTAMMVSIATEAVSRDVMISGVTAPWGPPLITSAEALDAAAEAVSALTDSLTDADGVIVAGFGDPGLEALRARLAIPVTGIAEAGMAEAARDGRRFAVVTTTPDLVDAIAIKATKEGHQNFAGTWVTPGDPARLMADAFQLETALHQACLTAIEDSGVEAIVIGGGPLAVAGRRLVGRIPVPLIEPVPAAARLACARARRKAGP